MKNERIDELDKICEDATDAPWTAEIYEYDVGVNGPFHKPICTTFDNRENKNSNKGDPIFIATARTALPEALVEIKELKKDLDKQLDQEGALLDYNIELRAEVKRLEKIEKNLLAARDSFHDMTIEAKDERDAALATIEQLKEQLKFPPQELLDKWFQNELSDFNMMLDHLTRTYDHFSGGRISKPNTCPEEVFGIAEEQFHKDVDEVIKEYKQERNAALATVDAVRKKIESLSLSYQGNDTVLSALDVVYRLSKKEGE
jgi:DNA repair exonuclease SbcCD ATPase subunit